VPGIGDTLREARMRQRLDIADVEAKTKIRAKYLRALENEEFGLLPGPTFVRTFLRTYAEVLGLDPHRLVDEYRARYEPSDEVEPLQPLGPPGRARRERRGIRPPGPGAVAVVVVLGLIAALFVLGLNADDDGGSNGEQAAGTETTETRERPRRRREPPPPPTTVTLRVAPVEPTYVCVDNGPGTEVVFMGTIDAAQTFKGKVVRVNLGKSSAELTVNGKRVEMEPTPNPVGWRFTPRGRQELPLGERPCA
jgi:cytoskeleton protein RodZ